MNVKFALHNDIYSNYMNVFPPSIEQKLIKLDKYYRLDLD